jgi:hypothetical protein
MPLTLVVGRRIKYMSTPQQVIIYARLSYLQGQTYFSIPLYDNKFVNVTKVNQTLELCLKTRNNDNHP